jgi:glutaredoxin
MNIVVYSTHCPQCKVLEKKLQMAGIEFTICDDMDKMNEMGMKSAPGLQVDGSSVMNFKDAMTWVKENTNG